jgi:hypothetical protein
MTVKQLQNELAKCNPDAVVMMMSDPEGNDCWKFDNVEGTYTVVTLWPGGR